MLILFLQVQDKFRLDLNDEEAVQFLQSLIDESVSAMFPVVVEQIHKFAQVNQSYINIYNLWFFHWRFIWSNVWWKIIIRSVLCDNKKRFIKLMHQKSMIVVIIHWCWKVIFHREDFNNISESTQRDDRKKRTAKRLCVTNVTGLWLTHFVVIFT